MDNHTVRPCKLDFLVMHPPLTRFACVRAVIIPYLKLVILEDCSFSGMACTTSDQRTSNPVVALGVKHRKSSLTNRL